MEPIFLWRHCRHDRGNLTQRHVVVVSHLFGDFVGSVIPELASVTDAGRNLVVQEHQVVDDVFPEQLKDLVVWRTVRNEPIRLDGLNGLLSHLRIGLHRLTHSRLVNGQHLSDGVVDAFNALRVLRRDVDLVWVGLAQQA